MGYTIDFSGSFQLNTPLQPRMLEFLKKFNETRRMKRNVDEAFGIEGEFYVLGTGSFGQGNEPNIIDFNNQPSTQPSLWCQWTPNEDGTAIEWDGGEKFYHYNEWLCYIINKILAPNGYVLNGTVTWQGEETGDVGKIHVVDNVITVAPWDEAETVMTAENVSKFSYKTGETTGYMRTDVVLIIDEQPLGIEASKPMLDEAKQETNESVRFAKWLAIYTDEEKFTQAPCRRYNKHVYTIDELYDIFVAL